MKKSELPGVTVRKSIKDALAAVRSEMEKQHFEVVNREKTAATKARKARSKPPG